MPLPPPVLAKGEADAIAVVVWITFMVVAAVSGWLKRRKDVRLREEQTLRGPAAAPLEPRRFDGPADMRRSDDEIVEVELEEEFEQNEPVRDPGDPFEAFRRTALERQRRLEAAERGAAQLQQPRISVVAPPAFALRAHTPAHEFATSEAHEHPELCASLVPASPAPGPAPEPLREPGQVFPPELASRLTEVQRLVLAGDILARRGAGAAGTRRGR